VEKKEETVSYERAGSEIALRKAEFEPAIKSKTLIITDTASSLDRIRNSILPKIDQRPKQVLIETRIMEVNLDKLKDIGFDWGTGSAGATTYANPPRDLDLNRNHTKTLAGRNLSSEFTPSVFGPKEGTSTLDGKYPYAAGLEVLFKKITGDTFEVIVHALEEDVNTNTLSAPRILTLDNQEAAILVGYHTPILKTDITTDSTSTSAAKITQTLHYYQEIGIRLNVVPQISDEGYINMIIHPSVTSSTSSVTATSYAGTTPITTSYPIIDVREAQTQIFIKDGETVVLGGLLKDIKSKETIGIPFLSKIPLLGLLFQREIVDNSKVDLLIFITARVLKDDEYSPEEIARLKASLGQEAKVEMKAGEKKKARRKKEK
jgi:type II secretory pathway component GspD/PulD (secretin)